MVCILTIKFNFICKNCVPVVSQRQFLECYQELTYSICRWKVFFKANEENEKKNLNDPNVEVLGSLIIKSLSWSSREIV